MPAPHVRLPPYPTHTCAAWLFRRLAKDMGVPAAGRLGAGAAAGAAAAGAGAPQPPSPPALGAAATGGGAPQPPSPAAGAAGAGAPHPPSPPVTAAGAAAAALPLSPHDSPALAAGVPPQPSCAALAPYDSPPVVDGAPQPSAGLHADHGSPWSGGGAPGQHTQATGAHACHMPAAAVISVLSRPQVIQRRYCMQLQSTPAPTHIVSLAGADVPLPA